MFSDRNIIGALALAVLVGLSGCTVDTHKSDDEKGEKRVEIRTPIGDLKVRNENVQASDTGLTQYPGSRIAPKKNEKDDHKANVDIDTPWFGVKVIAVVLEADDVPTKVLDFYRKDLAKYGKVVECKGGSGHFNPDFKSGDAASQKAELDCDEKNDKSDGVELKTGTRNNQRVAVVEPRGDGSKISLIWVRTRGDEDEEPGH
jgi:hypothetical protein